MSRAQSIAMDCLIVMGLAIIWIASLIANAIGMTCRAIDWAMQKIHDALEQAVDWVKEQR